jgi:hypothetical protein
MRPIQRHGDVAQAAVHADHARTGGQPVGQRAQVQPGPDLCLRAQRGAMRSLRACSAALPCGRPSVWPAAMSRRPSASQWSSGQHLSSREVPCTRATQRSAPCTAPCAPFALRAPGRNAQSRRHGVAQRLRAQHTRALHRVDVRRHGHRHIGHPARGPLVAGAVGLVGQRIALDRRAPAAPARPPGPTCSGPAGRSPRHRPRACRSALKAAQAARVAADSGALRQRRSSHGHHAAHALRSAHQRRKAALHHPVNLRRGAGGADVLHRRHGMHHIAKRRQLDDEHLQTRAPSMRGLSNAHRA